MVKGTAISSVSLPCFFGCPRFCGNPPTSAMTLWLCGTLTSSGSPPLLHVLPHFRGHILLSVSVPTSVGSQTQQVLLISTLTRTEVAGSSKRRRLCPGKSLAVRWAVTAGQPCALTDGVLHWVLTIPYRFCEPFWNGLMALWSWLCCHRGLDSFPSSQLLSRNGERYHQFYDPRGRGHPQLREAGHRVCAALRPRSQRQRGWLPLRITPHQGLGNSTSLIKGTGFAFESWCPVSAFVCQTASQLKLKHVFGRGF